MATGVGVHDTVAEQFQAFKLRREPYNFRYFIYSIADSTTVVIESTGERDATYEDFCSALPEDDCRYGLLDMDFETEDGRPTSKLVFFAWSPDTAPVRSKMLYAGSKDALRKVLVGVSINLTATDRSELDMDTVLPSVMKFA